jgi:hypothetical protein
MEEQSTIIQEFDDFKSLFNKLPKKENGDIDTTVGINRFV